MALNKSNQNKPNATWIYAIKAFDYVVCRDQCLSYIGTEEYKIYVH